MDKIPRTDTTYAAQDCLAGGGEMGALIRAFDWSSTPMGPVAAWPRSLKTALGILLASGYPMYIAWGPEFIQLYNDAYRPILGSTKHPQALGQRTEECFSEIWDFIGPMFRRALTTGEATTLTDQLLPLDRNGYVEECYFTFSYSAIPDETGAYGGVFVTVIETTQRVLSERRISTLRELATATAQARTTQQACDLIETTLGRNRHDLPFTLLYLLEEDGTRANLSGYSGLEAGQTASPARLELGAQEAWPLSEVKATGKSVLRTDLHVAFGALTGGAWPEAPHSALVLPITQPGQEQLAGFLVAGLSARLELDDSYRGYLDLMAGSVATVISNAQAYERERRQAEALAELDRAKTTFFSNVSHEFRTPLTLMLGQVEDILAKPEGGVLPESREALAVAHRNGLRLLKLVNTLLDFSRIEAGRVQAVYEPTDLSAYTAELAGVFRSAIEKAGMRLRVHCPPLSQPVTIDKEMWEKIVLNLLSNAFKFTEAGEIEVTLQEKGDRAELTIRDTGTGITGEQLPHIFERFHRVEGTRARTQEGTGIGLALVQELVKLHGGEVRVESEYGKGSAFTISLPLGTAHLPKERIQARRSLSSTAAGADLYITEALGWLPDEVKVGVSLPAESGDALNSLPGEDQSRTSRSCILVADDNADMRAYVSSLLRSRYDVIAVPDGRAALQAAQEHHPDLVLSDVMMPGLDGFELLEALRANADTRTLPVILLSARAGEEAQSEGFAAAADDYLIKPFSARELLARVAAHMKLAQVRKEANAEKERLLASIEAERTRLADLLEQAPAFIAVLRGPEHVFERVNRPYYQLVGQRELIGKTVREAFPEVEGQGFFELLDQVYRTGEPFVGEDIRIRFQEEEGAPPRERYLDFIYQPLIEADGSVSGIFVHGVDLTERKRAEEALQESELRLRSLFENARDAIGIATKGKILFVNPAYARLLGYASPQEMAGLSALVSVAPSDRERLARMAQSRNAGEAVPFSYEYRGIQKDGTECDLENYVSSYELGGQFYTVVTTRDITARKQEEVVRQFLSEASAVLASSLDYEQTLQKVADLAVPRIADWCGVDMLEADGSISPLVVAHVDPEKVKWGHELRKRYPPNPAAPTGLPNVLRTGKSEIYSNIPDEAIQAGARDPEHLKLIREIGLDSLMIVAMIARGRILGAITFVATDESGHHYTEEDLELAEGLAARAALAVDNARLYRAAQAEIVERRSAQEQIEALNVRLQRSMRETHHRVKNNLQIITALVNMQQMQYEGQVPTVELQRLVQHIQALASIHDLLTHQAQTDSEVADISVKDVMEKLMPSVQGMVEGRPITFAVQDIRVPIRQSTTFAVLVNELVSNALKHGAGAIHVEFCVEGNLAMLEVWDEGPGFPPGFDPLRAANTGLDLIDSLSRMDMRGTVRYENRSEGGARVVVTFPLPELAQTQAEQ